ncbi:MAG: adenine deaminase, partial [Paracoccaceae bacterium]
MVNNTFPSWPDTAPQLIAVAAGRAPADMVIQGGTWVNVHTRELLPDHDIAIVAGRIAYVGPDAAYCIGPDTQVIKANGRYMIPGLCDAHMHIESGMLTPAEFARAVIPHGTT